MENRHDRIRFGILCTFILHATLAYGQEPSTFEELFTKLNSLAYPLTVFDKLLLDFNIQRSYSYDERIQGSPIRWNPTKGKLQTHFYVQENSSFLKMSSKKQLEQFETQVNGIRLNLLNAFEVQDRIDKFWPETGRILEVELMTIEDDHLYIIGRYINGKALLVREKVGKPIKELLKK